MAVVITGVIQIVFGVLFWTGHAQALIPLHMLVGVLFVLSLWTVAALAIRARLSGILIVPAFVWGAVVLFFGLTQAQFSPGSGHWIIRVLHLVVGLGAMGQAGGLVRRIREGATHALGPELVLRA
jgi:hypothetical protein